MHKSVFLFNVNEKILGVADELNLNSVFVSYDNANQKNADLIRGTLGEAVQLFVLITVFSGEDLLNMFPDAKAVEASGKEIDTTGVCPTHPGVRELALKKVDEMLNLNVDGIWLDGLRYTTKWETPRPNILDTCYCDRCLDMFKEHIGEPIEGVGGEGSDLENTVLYIDGSYYHEWLEFKTNQIASIVAEIREKIDDSGVGSKLGFYAVPWKEHQYSAGIKRILGQDLDKLSEHVDLISPMLYHKMVGKTPDWVKEMVDHFWNFGKPFIPYIQTENKPDELHIDEFKLALNYASGKPSSGVCVFFLDDILNQPEKLEAVKELFSKS